MVVEGNTKKRMPSDSSEGITSFVEGSSSNESPVASQSSSSSSSIMTPRQMSLTSLVKKKNVTEAEIRWMLKCVSSKYSKRSCDDIADVFQAMFPDSEVAKKFTCAHTKCGYGILFGIYPYCLKVLQDYISESPVYSISFDECYNHVLHFGQMDFQIRIWKNHRIMTRYLTSEFL